MPFVTKGGGYSLGDGVIDTHKDVDGKVIQGNGLQVKRLVHIGPVALESESEEFKLAVMRGTPRAGGTSWETTPVFIIQHYDFTDADWQRFLEKFKKMLVSPSPSFIYEPAVYDVVDMEYGKRAMPLWVLEELEALNVFEKALSQTKMESTAKKLNETQLNLIREQLEKRRVEEAPKEEKPEEIKAPKEESKKSKEKEKVALGKDG